MNKRKCAVCGDFYSLAAFIRGADEDDFLTYSDDDWKQAVLMGKTFTIAGEQFNVSPFCHDCGFMISVSRKRNEEKLGHGPIKMRRAKDGKYVDMESHQEYMYMVSEAEPQYEFAADGEMDNRGNPLSFTDLDLAKLSMMRIRRVLVDKAFTDIPWWQIEDHAQSVSLRFLDKLACAGCGKLCYFEGNEPCDVATPGDSINNLHAYHWSCCKYEAKGMMEEWVTRRKAELPQDILDIGAANNMTDNAIVNAWKYGGTQVIDRHEREQTLFTRLEVDDMKVEFEGFGVPLSDREVKTLRGAIIGDNAGLKGKQRTKDILNGIIKKLEADGAMPLAYGALMKRITG